MDAEKAFPIGASSQKGVLTSGSSARKHQSSNAPEVYHKELSSPATPEVYTAPEVYYGETGLYSLPQNIHPVDRASELHQLQADPSRPNGRYLKSIFQRHRGLCIILVTIALIACLGAGLGIGLHFRLNSDSLASSMPSPTAPTTVTSTSSSATSLTTSSTSSTSTLASFSTAPPTTGRTGMAANHCRTRGDNSYTTSNNPTSFVLECETDYPNGGAAYSGSGNVTDLSAHLIAYTFEECIESCAIYNEQNPGSMACTAVTYNASLTGSVASQLGNCFLKSARGMPVTNDSSVEANVASAYAISLWRDIPLHTECEAT